MLRAAILTKPSKKTSVQQWAKDNRFYPASADRPGQRDPGLTPYIVPFAESFTELQYDTSVLVCGSQMGKSEAVLDVIGHQMDQRPAPVLYVGPNQHFITEELEPRLMALINNSPSLATKLARGKKNKLYSKLLGGVPIRLAWAGSATQLASTSARLNLADELDRMLDNVKDEGDPLGLLEARGFTYRDRKYGATSTPKKGYVETDLCRHSGLEFFKRMAPEDIESPIWQLWQQGTMYHWSWPCPYCDTYFIPKLKNLKWPDDATPMEAKLAAYLLCPNCKTPIYEASKRDMNARGVYVAPGQQVKPDETVMGEPPASTILSCWVSGLCSPFVTFGERASSYLKAKESGNPAKIQASINTGFGELYAPGGGDVPEWKEVAKLRQPYTQGTLPEGVQVLTMAVDVQTDCLVYVIRGWGARAASWLIEHGVLYGETKREQVWLDLADLLYTPIQGLRIRRCLIDSGFRPGKPDDVPVNRVYEFCRVHKRIASPAKGYATRARPITVSKIEVKVDGKAKKYGLELLLLDTDYFKSWVHSRIRWPEDEPGAWLLAEDVTQDYCKQIVSEARVKTPGKQVTWVRRSKNNHFLDCEALNVAAGELLNVYRIKDGTIRSDVEEGGDPPVTEPEPRSESSGSMTWDQISNMLG